MDQNIALALIALLSSITTLIMPKLFSKKKDAVDMYSELQKKLYEEIDRLEVKIKVLEQKEIEAYKLEEKLTKRILELEQDNKRQSYEIEQLKNELSKYVKNN
jgi:predicted Holliday junction resolvase-like endonuclease